MHSSTKQEVSMNRTTWLTTAAFALVVGMVAGARAAPTDTGQSLPQILVAHDGQFGPDMKFVVPDEFSAMLLPSERKVNDSLDGPQRPVVAVGATDINASDHWKDGVGVPWGQEACSHGNMLTTSFDMAWATAGSSATIGQNIWSKGGGLASATLMRSGAEDGLIPINAKNSMIG